MSTNRRQIRALSRIKVCWNKIPTSNFAKVISSKQGSYNVKIEVNHQYFNGFSWLLPSQNHLKHLFSNYTHEFFQFVTNGTRLTFLLNHASTLLNDNQGKRSANAIYKANANRKAKGFKRNPEALSNNRRLNLVLGFEDTKVKNLVKDNLGIILPKGTQENVREALFNEVSERIMKYQVNPSAIPPELIDQIYVCAFITHKLLNTSCRNLDGNTEHSLQPHVHNNTLNKYKPVTISTAAKQLPRQTSSCAPNTVSKHANKSQAKSDAKRLLDEIKDSKNIVELFFSSSIPCEPYTRTPTSLSDKGFIHQTELFRRINFSSTPNCRIIWGAPHVIVLIETCIISQLIKSWKNDKNTVERKTAIGIKHGEISDTLRRRDDFFKNQAKTRKSKVKLYRSSIDFRAWDSTLHPIFLMLYYTSVATATRLNNFYSFKVIEYLVLYMVFTPYFLTSDEVYYQLRGNYSGGESTTTVNCFANWNLTVMQETHLSKEPFDPRNIMIQGDDNIRNTSITLEQCSEFTSIFDSEVNIRKSSLNSDLRVDFQFLGFYWMPLFSYAPTQTIGWVLGRTIYPERFVTDFGTQPIWIDRILSVCAHLVNGYTLASTILKGNPEFNHILDSREYSVIYLGPDQSQFKVRYPLTTFRRPHAYLFI
uniref:RdRp n=1 Tax=viral metagenome TaxID=1070528 RepID=A0A2V0RB89_9ZZZZ